MLEQKDLEMITKIVENAVNPIKDDIKALESTTAEIVEKEIKPIKSDIKAIELTLENETNKGIKIIAEGHLDLSRKLDEALKIENEKEMLKLRLNRLESEVEKIKAKLEETA